MLTHFAGLHSTEVSRLERRLREPRLATVLQVAEALRVPVAELTAPPHRQRSNPPAPLPAPQAD
jgi:transcriptional regulator with XRE-family HTH domain